ncbi:glycosyltransferase family 2 protein (plasmid) [Halorussus salilacus]|uniref:glycosyltransferase family 2 protein n=1 Tax=Halorussus salilacus TaxID=2953750 RepID=UPI00209FC4F4|nr:glycosyltransferase family 2 protein [Halorussus salilacus]USZ69751.1 glycosyltransferase family 2 protein [Halorussus salilacus]
MGSTNEYTENEHRLEAIPTGEKVSPALSIIAHELDLGTVARTLLRANEHGVFSFVVVPETDYSLIGRLAEKLGSVVLELEFEDDSPVDTVERVARAYGFPAMLYVDSPGVRVDTSRFEEAAEATDSYTAAAPLVDEPSRESVDTVAAIPAYNEEDTVGSVVERARPHVDEVVVVDDGSTDETVAAAERAGATVVEHGTNRGYGATLQTAFEAADDRNADALVTLDGDGQHDPEDIPKLLARQRETDANVVVGSRFRGDANAHVPRYRRFGLFVINVLTNLSMGAFPFRSWVSDTQSGFRAFDARAIESLAGDGTLGDDMGASTDILYHARRNGYAVEEVGTTIRYDGDETSTQNPISHGLSVVSNILRTVERERPLTFVGLPGIAAVTVGMGFGYWGVVNYVQTGTFPTGIVLICLFSTFLGSLLSFAGVILHSIQTHVGPPGDGSVGR